MTVNTSRTGYHRAFLRRSQLMVSLDPLALLRGSRDTGPHFRFLQACGLEREERAGLGECPDVEARRARNSGSLGLPARRPLSRGRSLPVPSDGSEDHAPPPPPRRPTTRHSAISWLTKLKAIHSGARNRTLPLALNPAGSLRPVYREPRKRTSPVALRLAPLTSGGPRLYGSW